LDADTFLGQIIGRVFKRVSDMKKKEPKLNESDEKKKLLTAEVQ
jgi:hypothetical protein